MAWERIKNDSARRYRNTETGEIISRHHYDTRYGLLKKQGYSGYKQKVKATPEAERKKKPAPGRRGLLPKSLRRVGPYAGKQTRGFVVPGHVKRGEDIGEFHDEFILEFGNGVNEIYVELSKNKKVMAYAITMQKMTPEGEENHVTIWPSIVKQDAPQWPFVVASAGEMTYPGDIVISVSVIARFYDEHVKPDLRKKRNQLRIKK